MGWVLLTTIAFVFLTNRAVIHAQAPQAETPNAQSLPTPTLHVYENLRQVPVLVLTSKYQRMKPVDTSKFRISLDAGQLFRPTYVRQEGEDPISLAILIDASKPGNDMLPQLSQAIAALAPDYLHPQDHVSIYLIDCTLNRTAYDAPANATMLKQSVDMALTPWQIRRDQKPRSVPPCKASMPLWDSMNNVLDDLTQLPGRRVLLAITDGVDEGSNTMWRQLMLRVQLRSVAVFGLRPAAATIKPEDKFNQICNLSGGVEIQPTDAIVSWRLQEFTKIVRERYILEFPRGRDEKAGIHALGVFYRNKSDLYIVSTGISVSVASEDEKKGANTILEDPSRAPAEGSRKVLLPKQ
jgi:hypothetical protein